MSTKFDSKNFRRVTSELLTDLGFELIKKQTYKYTNCDAAFDIFIYLFQERGAYKGYFSADFGFRHRSSDLFSVECFRRYGNETARTMLYDVDSTCLLTKSLSSIVLDFNGLFSSAVPFKSEIVRLKEIFIQPAIVELSSRANIVDFYDIMISGEGDSYYSWGSGDAALRCGVVMYLGSLMGKERADFLIDLKGLSGHFPHSRVKEFQFEEYIDVLIAVLQSRGRP